MAKKPTYEELEAKVNFYEYSIEESRKQVRKALAKYGIWNQEFHENEVVAITAVFLATKEELDRSQAVIEKNILYIAEHVSSMQRGAAEFNSMEECVSYNKALTDAHIFIVNSVHNPYY